MRKFIIGWITLFLCLAFYVWLDKKIQPQVIEMPYIVEKIVEKEVYKPIETSKVYSGEKFMTLIKIDDPSNLNLNRDYKVIYVMRVKDVTKCGVWTDKKQDIYIGIE